MVGRRIGVEAGNGSSRTIGYFSALALALNCAASWRKAGAIRTSG